MLLAHYRTCLMLLKPSTMLLPFLQHFLTCLMLFPSYARAFPALTAFWCFLWCFCVSPRFWCFCRIIGVCSNCHGFTTLLPHFFELLPSWEVFRRFSPLLADSRTLFPFLAASEAFHHALAVSATFPRVVVCFFQALSVLFRL